MSKEYQIEPSDSILALVNDIKQGKIITLPQSAKIDSPESNLDIYPKGYFVGREGDRRRIDRLQREGARLITLTGLGGVGKTQLVLEIAHDYQQLKRFSKGVFFISLAETKSVAQALEKLAQSLNFPLVDTQLGIEGVKSYLLDYLRDKDILLLFDNFESCLEVRDFLSDVLTETKAVVIATSREALATTKYPALRQHEYLINLNALHLEPSQSLFEWHAKRSLAAEETKAFIRIHELLDGLPLGLELAASLAKELSCKELVDKLEEGMNIIENVNSERTLETVFKTSYQSLDNNQQHIYKQLSVFRGGFDDEAAKVIASVGTTDLQHLVDKSLLSQNRLGRYNLHSVLQHFARENLTENVNLKAETESAHTAYYSTWLSKVILSHRDIDRNISIELDNARAAWQKLLDDNVFSAADLSKQGYFAFRLESLTEAEKILRQALTNFSQAEPELGRCHYTLGLILKRKQFKEGETHYRQALAIAEIHKDQMLEAEVLNSLGLILIEVQKFKEAKSYLEKSLDLWELLSQPEGLAETLRSLGRLEAIFKNYDKSQQHLTKACLQFENLDMQSELAKTLNNLGIVYRLQNNLNQAQQVCEKALDIYQELGERSYRQNIAEVQGTLGQIIAFRDSQKAIEHYQKALESFEELGNREKISLAHNNLAVTYTSLANFEKAEEHYARALEIAHSAGIRACVIHNFAWISRLFHKQHKQEMAVALAKYAQEHGQDPEIVTITDKVLSEQLNSNSISLPVDNFDKLVETVLNQL